MKKICLSVLFGALILSGCNKDKDDQENIQIQQIEIEEEARVKFSYNDQSFVTKMEVDQIENGGYIPQGYINFTYNNGLPSTAEVFAKDDNDNFGKITSVKFSVAGSNLAYAAFIDYNNGQPDEDSKDTSYFSFNSSNQLVGLQFGYNGNRTNLSYDTRGNLLLGATTVDNEEVKTTFTIEHAYDGTTNPFRFNGLGLLMTVLDFGEIELPDQLLSFNNSTMLKSTTKYERKEQGQIVGTSYHIQAYNRTFTFDASGLLTGSVVTGSSKNINEDQQEVNEPGFTRTYKYTCVRK